MKIMIIGYGAMGSVYAALRRMPKLFGQLIHGRAHRCDNKMACVEGASGDRMVV